MASEWCAYTRRTLIERIGLSLIREVWMKPNEATSWNAMAFLAALLLALVVLGLALQFPRRGERDCADRVRYIDSIAFVSADPVEICGTE